MSAEDFVFERVGDEFSFAWHEYGMAIGFEMLRQERFGLTGEIHVRTTSRLASTGRPGHLFSGMYNLSKLEDRDKHVKALKERNDQVPWLEMFEIARVETARRFRQGEPAVRLADVEFSPQLHLIENVLPLHETSVFYGDGASTKSMCAAAIALAVAADWPIGPFSPTVGAPVPVLVIDYETSKQEWSERCSRIARGAGMTRVPEEVHWREAAWPLKQDLAAVRAEVARIGAQLIVVDSIALACGGEVNSDNAIPVFSALRTLTGTTRLVISHVSRANTQQASGAGDPYGTVFVKNLARSAWAVHREEGDNGYDFEVSLVHRKVNRGRLQKPIGVRFTFDDPAGPIAIKRADMLANPILQMHAGLAERIANVLRSGRLTSKELASTVGSTEDTVARTCRRMMQQGSILRLDTTAGPERGRGHEAVWGLKNRTNITEPLTTGVST